MSRRFGVYVGEHSYKFGDVVLAMVPGFPRQWPGMVVDPEAVSSAVAKGRPGSKFYYVRFFPAGSYSWVLSEDLSLLKKHEIEAYINGPHRKLSCLLPAYNSALNPTKWVENLKKQRVALEVAKANEGVEDDDEEAEFESEKSKTSQKRKREEPKKKEDPKKNASTEAKEKRGIAQEIPGKEDGHRSKDTVVESEDEGAEITEGEDALDESSRTQSGPVSKRARKDKGCDDGNIGLSNFSKYCKSPSLEALSSARVREAIVTLESRETHLDDNQVVALSDLFVRQRDMMDAYMSFARPGVRRIWVYKRLKELGFPGDPEENDAV